MTRSKESRMEQGLLEEIAMKPLKNPRGKSSVLGLEPSEIGESSCALIALSSPDSVEMGIDDSTNCCEVWSCVSALYEETQDECKARLARVVMEQAECYGKVYENRS